MTRVHIWPSAAPEEDFEYEADKVSFVNDESYGPPLNLGVSETGSTLLINLGNAVAVVIEGD
jgi:hypothetical protein